MGGGGISWEIGGGKRGDGVEGVGGGGEEG